MEARLAVRTFVLAIGLATAITLTAVFGLGDAAADRATFDFATGTPDGLMAMASCPSCGAPASEHETADDFVLSGATDIESATFTGLLPSAAPSVSDVRVQIYRVYPDDSDTGRTIQVPTRANSPADVELADRGFGSGNLSYTKTILNTSFSANNSVLDGIHQSPSQTTGGDGFVSGEEVQFNVTFTTPFDLAPGHYFFVPQVQLSSGSFYWLSAPRPIVAPAGTPFSPDLQTWIRKDSLDPDWLRVGTDIVGGSPTFNGAFTLHGKAACQVTVSPSTLPTATVGGAYAAAFGASGNDGPFTFTESGSLPSGMSFAADGSLSGTPTQAGSFPIAVTAKGSTGCSAGDQVTLTVTPAGTGAASTTGTNGAGVPPSLSAVGQSHRRWREGRRLARLARKRKPPVGTTFSFTLNEQARVSLAFTQRRAGRRVKGRCVAPTKRNRHKRACRRTVPRGTLTFAAHPGVNKVSFQGRTSRTRKLKPGRYTVTVTASNSAGRSSPKTLSFTIVK